MRSRPLCLCLHVDFASVLHNKCQDKGDMHSKMSTKTTNKLRLTTEWCAYWSLQCARSTQSENRSFFHLSIIYSNIFHWHFMCLKRIFFLALQILFPFRWVFIWFVFDKVNTMAFYQVHCVWFAAKCKEEMQPNSTRLYNTHTQDAVVYLLFSYLLTFQCYCKNILAS